jgi:hypothetical protein
VLCRKRDTESTASESVARCGFCVKTGVPDAVNSGDGESVNALRGTVTCEAVLLCAGLFVVYCLVASHCDELEGQGRRKG